MSFPKFLKERSFINNDLYDLISAKYNSSDFDIYDFLLNACDLSEQDINILKSEYFKLDYTDLKYFEKIDGLNYESLKNLSAIPFEISSGTTHIAISDPNNLYSMDKINFCLSSCDRTKNLKKKFYIANKRDIEYKFQEICKIKDNLLDEIIFNAVRLNASDIHITPYENTFEIMFRNDGDIELFKTLNIDQFEQISISLKVTAKLDISETRRPQSGHFQKDNIDFRISTHPTTTGENIVIRILNKNKSFISIENIGFSKEKIEFLKKIISFSNGMIIFCGPTGSGKTTSIYSILETMDKKSNNIMTLEDPIEYRIQNVKQTEIKRGVINFADGIRSILRQDPDVILIGEIRDEETAQMAIRASMTGHLVLTTIHSNDSVGALARFKEFGISHSLIADNIIAIISQRIVKKKDKGRTIISEILEITQELSSLIYCNSSKRDILECAITKNGFKTMHTDCLDKVTRGIISENEMKNILRIGI